MDKPFVCNRIDSISNINIPNTIFESPYKYNGVTVPRVTSILSDMLHEEYLMGWANYMGRVKHVDHTKYTETAAHIGTIGHDAIEKYILTKEIDTFDTELITDNRNKAKNVLSSFIKWWDIINRHKVEVLMIEQSLSCELYGGTLDMLIKIDDKIYLVDFKISNHFNYKYHLQTAAYRRMLWFVYGILLDGIIILRLSKNSIYFIEQLLDLSTYRDLKYINDCDRCFLSLVYAYYNRKVVEDQYKNFWKE